ncbi:MAG: hypothetical protein LBQ83_01710, partial [Candidatus Margulisbacteria bacterium]|nr:hypothetical protein [Candidatus Margulisiibacteriota bacterium]
MNVVKILKRSFLLALFFSACLFAETKINDAPINHFSSNTGFDVVPFRSDGGHKLVRSPANPGVLHAVFYDGTGSSNTYKLIYATSTNDGASWTKRELYTITGGGTSLDDPAIAVDSSGRVYISYGELNTGRGMLNLISGSNLLTDPITPVTVTYNTSQRVYQTDIAVDSAGYVNVAMVFVGSGDASTIPCKIMVYTGRTANSINGGFDEYAVQETGKGFIPRLFPGSGGDLFLTFDLLEEYSITSRRLIKVYKRASGSWNTGFATINNGYSSAYRAQHPGLALDQSSNV